MKKLIIILTLIYCSAKGQDTLFNNPKNGWIQVNPTAAPEIRKGLAVAQTLGIPTGNVPPNRLFHGDIKQANIYFDSTAGRFYVRNPKDNTWAQVSGSGSADSTVGGNIRTQHFSIGSNPGDSLTPKQWIKKVFYGFVAPTTTLASSATLELTGASTVARTLSWSSTRSDSPTIASILVGGVTQTFSQPVIAGTVSGTQLVNAPANTTTTYQNVTTGSDGQISISSITIDFLPRKYYGWLSDTTGIMTGSQDAAIRAIADQPLSGIKDVTFSRPISGTQFFFEAYPDSEGTLSTITFNGFETKDAMNTGTRSFTNGSSPGYTQTYRFYWNKLAQNTTSTIITH